MRKTISLPKYIDDMLRDVSKRQEQSMSTIIQHALIMFFMLEKHSPNQMKNLNSMIPEGQTHIFDYLKNSDN